MESEKKGFFSSLGDLTSKLIMSEVDGPETTKEAPAQVSVQTSAPVQPSTSPSLQTFQTPQINTDSEADQELLSMLKGKIDKKNPSGYDYIEFSQGIVKMATILKTTDPSVVFPATFGPVESMGVTKDYLIKTADMCIVVLDEEKSNFENEISKQNSNTENSKAKLLDIDSKIQLLSEEIQKLSAEKIEVSSSIEEDAKGIQLASNKFSKAYETYKNKVLSDRNNISKYL